MAPQVTFFTGYPKILQLYVSLATSMENKTYHSGSWIQISLAVCHKPLEPVCGQRRWDAVIGQAKVTLMGLSLEQLYEDRVWAQRGLLRVWVRCLFTVMEGKEERSDSGSLSECPVHGGLDLWLWAWGEAESPVTGLCTEARKQKKEHSCLMGSFSCYPTWVPHVVRCCPWPGQIVQPHLLSHMETSPEIPGGGIF